MIAKRYARALLELSIKEGNSEPVMKEIAAVGDLMRKSKYFDFFTSRVVRTGEKLEALGSLSPLTRDFLRLVIANKREEDLYLISREYIELLNDRNGVVDGTVSSRLPLTAQQKMALKGKLEKRLKRSVNLSFRTDRKIIGGLSVSYGGRTIDGTVNGMLKGYLAAMTGK